ncbi:MAG TPA: kanamycin nucleotidyltransferase C-terminal domain-containing protein [Thermoplasmata archaeon]|nr:kanamycin nucleotidyltransferase C-terminal domain-containing protein [Thermoplasmata archaeon]
MLELRGDAVRHGFLDGVALHDPEGLLPKLRARVAALPESFVRASATEALHEMYEYVCKARNARQVGDRANLEYAARVTAAHATSVVALLNHRHYKSENTISDGWREFPDLPPKFATLVPQIFEGGLPNRRLYDTAMAVWDSTRAWAARRGVRLHTVRTLPAIRAPKTT